MITLQQQLNDATNGKNWEAGMTKNDKAINWKRCIYMECAEMVDSFAWKHWKSIAAPADWANHKIEVVDVWHFVISLALQEYKQKNLGSIDALVKKISMFNTYNEICTDEANYAEESMVITQVEQLMLDVLKPQLNLDILLDNFFILVTISGLNLQSLYELYVGKNILNQFRQNNGYKEGNYIKVWNGDEDNVVMTKLWQDNSALTPELLYTKLDEVYKTL